MKYIIVTIIMSIIMLFSSIIYWQFRSLEYRNSFYILKEQYPRLEKEWFDAIKNETEHVAIICALIDHETISTWNPGIVSPSGAVGLMQIMPYHKVEDRSDPLQNIKFGIKYLMNECLKKSDGNISHAIALYHGGPNRKILRKIDIDYVFSILGKIK